MAVFVAEHVLSVQQLAFVEADVRERDDVRMTSSIQLLLFSLPVLRVQQIRVVVVVGQSLEQTQIVVVLRVLANHGGRQLLRIADQHALQSTPPRLPTFSGFNSSGINVDTSVA